MQYDADYEITQLRCIGVRGAGAGAGVGLGMGGRDEGRPQAAAAGCSPAAAAADPAGISPPPVIETGRTPEMVENITKHHVFNKW